DPQPTSTSWTTGLRRIGWPGVSWTSDPIVTKRSYEQGIMLLRGALEVRVKWTFGATVRFDGSLRFDRVGLDKAGPFWLKEPEFAFALENCGVSSVSFPRTHCPKYDHLIEPGPWTDASGKHHNGATGRCADPDRSSVIFGGGRPYRLRVDDVAWRALADRARQWKRAGDDPCGGVTKRT